ncbi:MAG: efflux RND transporter permease subunit, partial [Heliobacteriaceae bacterium]|nr:efflux RND transporter permease subunit [Heliobacteriaceae bacterium]
AVYQRLLNWALMHRRTVIAAYLAVILATGALIPLKAIGTEFLARSDQGQFTISIELPPGTALDETDRFLRQLDQKIHTLPEVEFAFTAVGYGQAGSGAEIASHVGSVTVALYPKSERRRSVWAVADQVRSWAAEIPGARIMVQEAALIGTRTEAPILVDISGNDEAQLAQLAEQVMTIVRQTPGTADVDTSWRLGLPEMQVGIDRLRAAGYGLSVYDISRTMRTSLDGEIAGKYRDGNTETDIRVQVAGIDKHPQDLERLFVANNQGLLIPVNEVADITEGTGPTKINRQDRQRLVTVSANLKGRPLGDVKSDLERQFNRLPLPPGCQLNLSGESQDMDEAFRDLLFALGLSILLVYMILVILYESFLIPFIRMFTTPLGIAGGLLALWLTGHTINMMSLIGIIMLDGLAGKNGTLLIDYTNTLMDRGKPLREALVEAAATRLRPIFMTSFTMMFGMLPTALALSEGAEIRVGMAIVLIGGLVATTLFTLLVIPVVYTLIDDFRQWLNKKTGHKPRRRLTDADLIPGNVS